MSALVLPRAVVFTLADLPEGDRAQLQEVAGHLRLPTEPGSLQIPLVLLPRGAQLSIPGLICDADVARGGPSLLLLAMRLILADAYSWPEVRYLLQGDAAEGSAEAGYALYAGDPDRFTADTLAQALGPRCAEVRRGLLPRAARPPAAPGDRVPVLGWQVPVFGSSEPVSRLRDLRPVEQRAHRFCDKELPLGVVPGGESGPYRLFLRVLDTWRQAQAQAQAQGDRGLAAIEILLGDSRSGQLRAGQLIIIVRDLAHLAQLPDGPMDLDDDESLAEVLREVLPLCLQPTPAGDLLLCDLFHLGLGLADQPGSLEMVPQVVTAAATVRFVPGLVHFDAGEGEEEWAALLDPALWGLSTLCGMLAPEDVWVSEGGRYLALRLCGRRDGQPVDGGLVLDTSGRARAVAWPMDLDGPAPGMALYESADGGWLALAGGRAGAPVGLSCLGAGAEVAGVLLLCQLPDVRISARVALPAPLCAAGPPTLYAISGDTLLCHQPAARLFCVVTGLLGGAPVVRRATPVDLRAALLREGGGPLRQLLCGLAGPGLVEPVPALAFLGTELLRRLRRDAQGLTSLPVGESAEAVLRAWLQGEAPPLTCEGDEVRGLV